MKYIARHIYAMQKNASESKMIWRFPGDGGTLWLQLMSFIFLDGQMYGFTPAWHFSKCFID